MKKALIVIGSLAVAAGLTFLFYVYLLVSVFPH